jgi:hypothetical protein
VTTVRLHAWSCALLIATPVAFGACDDEPDYEKPTPPNLDELLAAYDEPTADFDPADMQSIADTAQALWDELQQTALIDQVVDVVQEVAEQQQEVEGQTSTTLMPPRHLMAVKATGTLRGTRICNGWGPEPEPDLEANGFLRLTVNLNEQGLDPVVWGTAERCHYKVSDSLVLLENPSGSDSAIAAHLGSNATVEGLGDSPILFRFGLRITVDDESHELEQDLRYDISQELLELRVSVADGFVIAGVSAGALGQIRARNGTFSCQTDPLDCSTLGSDR